MSFYDDKILPHLINCACSSEPIMGLRREVVPKAFGEVLEVGMGSAINLALYDAAKVTKVWGLEPSKGMRLRAEKNLARSTVPVQWLDLPGESVPLRDESVDCVLLTYTLCTIPDWEKALSEMHRVLKPGGKLLFCEHGLAPDAEVVRWQQRLNPLWNKVFGGCNLNRPVLENIAAGGFEILSQDTLYLEKSPRFASFMTYGEALKV